MNKSWGALTALVGGAALAASCVGKGPTSWPEADLATRLQTETLSLQNALSGLFIAARKSANQDDRATMVEMVDEAQQIQVLLTSAANLVSLLKYVDGESEHRGAVSEVTTAVRAYEQVVALSQKTFEHSLQQVHGGANSVEAVKVKDALDRAQSLLIEASRLER